MNKFLPAMCVSALLLSAATAPCLAEEAPQERQVQVFFGVLELDDQTGEWEDIADSDVDVDFSSLPSGGIEAEFVYGKGWVHWGINTGGSVAWKSEDTNFSGSSTGQSGGTVIVELDNSLLLIEAHLGGYVRGRLTDRITTYAAAGPMVIYGSHDIEDENIEERPVPVDGSDIDIPESDSSDINLGFYARAGVDFEIGKNQHLGLGVRYLNSELDFNDTVGKLDVEGPQYMLTFTTAF